MKNFFFICCRYYITKHNQLGNLRLGLFNSAEYKGTLKTEAGALGNAIRQLNDTLGTFYKVSDIINRDELLDIRRKWDNIPLGLNEEDREKYLRSLYQDKVKDKFNLIKEQNLLRKEQRDYDKMMFEEKRQKKKEFKLKQETSQAPASMTLPKLDNTIMASMSTTNTGAIDPTTLLTGNEEALLSPLEKAYYTNKRTA